VSKREATDVHLSALQAWTHTSDLLHLNWMLYLCTFNHLVIENSLRVQKVGGSNLDQVKSKTQKLVPCCCPG